MIKESAAAEHFAIAQHRDARLAAFHAIQQLCGYRVKAVSDHLGHDRLNPVV